MLNNYNYHARPYAVPGAMQMGNEFRPSLLEDYGEDGDQDVLGAAGTIMYRPHHGIQYTELVVQDGEPVGRGGNWQSEMQNF